MVNLTPAEGACLLDIATAPDPTKSILTGYGVVQHAELTESFNGWAVSATFFQAYANDYASKVLLPIMHNTEPLVWFRITIDSGNGTPVSRPWEPHWLTYYQSLNQNDSSSATILIQTADLLFKLDRAEHTANFSGLASDMVVQIGKNRFPSMKMVCEPTNQAYTLFQSVQTDWAFIRDRVKPRSLNAQGQGAYQMYARSDSNGTPMVVFATAAYAAIGQQTWNVEQGPALAIGKIMFSDRSRLRAIGAAGANTVPATPYTPGAQGPSASNPNDALRFGDTPYTSLPDEVANVNAHVGDTNTQNELTALAQNKYGDQRLDVYRAEFQMAQSPLLRIGDFLNVTTQVNDHCWDGLFAIGHLHHTVVRGSLTTKVIGMRGESNSPGGTTTSVPMSNPQSGGTAALSSSAAPGQPPAAGTVDTSQPSQGGGDTGNTVQAQDPNAAYPAVTANDFSTTAMIPGEPPDTPATGTGTSGVLNLNDPGARVPYTHGQNSLTPTNPGATADDPLPSND